MPDGQPPQLPDTAPLDLREFIECRRDSVTITGGELTWLPLPPEVMEYAPTPTLGLEPGASAGTGTISIGLGFATLTLPVSIVDGELHMDTSGVSAIPGAKEAIDTWLKELNDWLKKSGKRFKQTSIRNGSVTLTKEPIPVAPAAPPPAPPGPPVKPVTPVPPATGGGIGGSCALFGLLGVVLVGVIGAAWFTGIIPGGGGGGGSQPQSSPPAVAQPSTTSSTAAIPSSAAPIAKPSSAPPKAPAPVGARPALDLLDLSPSAEEQIRWIEDLDRDMFFPQQGQTPTQYFAESDLTGATGFLTTITEAKAQAISGFACAKEGKLPDGTVFRMACNQDTPLVAGEYVIFITTHAGGYPTTFPSAGNHSWAVMTNPDDDVTTGFQSSLADNYLIGADTYIEMLAFTNASGQFSNYILATRMADPVRADTGQKQGNLPTIGRTIWFDEIGTQLWIIPKADFGTNWYAGNFATLNRGANSPANLAADALGSPGQPEFRDYNANFRQIP